MTTAKIQHYVPQFLLRSFAVPKKAQVWVYDKSSGRSFISNTKNVASENRFYDFEHGDQRLSLEPWLADLEARAQLVVKCILESDSVSALSNEQRHVLAAFLAVQLTRTKTFREEWGAFPRMLREHFEKSGDQVAPGSQAEDLIKDFSKNETKEQTARIVHQAPQDYAAHFLEKEWVLAATTPEQPFLLSDNPLTRQNLIERRHRGNLGLKSPGIEIYLPLSPTRALAMWCSTLVELVHRGARSFRSSAGDSAEGANDPEGLLAMSNALLHGGPVRYSPANVENFNSLQVIWSERYIFSTGNDFHLAQTMLAQYPNLRSGPRSTVA